MTPITGTFLVLNTLLWLVYFGAGQPESWTRFFLVPADFMPVSLLSSQFVHQSALHVALNMLLLWTFGRSVERALGSGLFTVLYLGCGVFAGLLHVAVAHLFQARAELVAPAGGASGAVAGVMGAYAALFPHRRLRLPFVDVRVAGFAIILVWLGWEAAQAVVALKRGIELGVGHWAHVGGLVCGLILGPPMSGGSRDTAGGKLDGSDEELPTPAGSPFQAATRAAADAVERLTVIGAREHALALYRQAVDEGRPLPLPGPVEYHVAVWLLEECDWTAACDAFLSVAHAERDPELAANALHRAIEVARDHLRRPQLADRLEQELVTRFPESGWSIQRADQAEDGEHDPQIPESQP